MKNRSQELNSSRVAGCSLTSCSLLGFYWWKGGTEEEWQIVEVFEQGGVIMVGRIARWRCWPLSERGGRWGIMIPRPSVQGYWQACVINMMGAALACTEALHVLVYSRIQKDQPSCHCRKPSSANLLYHRRSTLADWFGLNEVLPFGPGCCKCDQEVLVGQESSSSISLANVQEHAPLPAGADVETGGEG
jgi:hypothetical protein